MLTKALIVLTLSLVAVAAFALRPVAWGGATTYVTTRGTSMEPKFHSGDLAILRRAAHYQVGDVVAYHSATLDTVVMHRVVALHDGRFDTKGDNNPSIDPDHPSAAQITGKLWMQAPHGGRAFTAAGLLVLSVGAATLLLAGQKRRRSRRPSRSRSASTPHGQQRNWRTTTITLCWIAIASTALTAVAFTRPTSTTKIEKMHYVNAGTFSYSTQVPSDGVYQGSQLRTGDPVFLAIIHRLAITFDYRIDGVAPDSIRGDATLNATITGSNGWERTVVLSPRHDFSGARSSIVGTLDLVAIRALITNAESVTGFRGSYTVAVVPRVRTHARLDGQPAVTSFAPPLVFDLDAIQLSVAGGSPSTSDQPPVLRPRAEETITRASASQARLGVGDLSVPISALRFVVMLVALVSVGAAVVSWRNGSRCLGPQAARFTLRHGHHVIEIDTAPDITGPITDVVSISDLERLSAAQGSSILYESSTGRDVYWCETDGRAYRYTARTTDTQTERHRT